MSAPSDEEAIRQVSEMLADWLGVGGKGVSRQKAPRSRADAVLELGKHFFVVEWKSSCGAAVVSEAARQVRARAARVSKKAIPLVVVPTWVRLAASVASKQASGGSILSGNARIVTPGMHILIEGRANRFKPRGRPSSAFAPKA